MSSTTSRRQPADTVHVECERIGVCAVLDVDVWLLLNRLKLRRLRLLRGHVYALAGRYRVSVGRLMTRKEGDHNVVIAYRNGNPLDLRASNVFATPRRPNSRP